MDVRTSKYSEEQIIAFLRQAEAGMSIKEIGRKYGLNDASFYKWRAKYGGMDATEAERLRELELKNGKLKRLLAEAHLDIHALKSVFGKKLIVKRQPHKSNAKWSAAWSIITNCPHATPAPLWG